MANLDYSALLSEPETTYGVDLARTPDRTVVTALRRIGVIVDEHSVISQATLDILKRWEKIAMDDVINPPAALFHLRNKS